jgi:hypothetical protein
VQNKLYSRRTVTDKTARCQRTSGSTQGCVARGQELLDTDEAEDGGESSCEDLAGDAGVSVQLTDSPATLAFHSSVRTVRGHGTLIVVVKDGTLSAFAVIVKLNGAEALPDVAEKNRLKPDVSPGFRLTAPGTTNGTTSSVGVYAKA